MRERSVCLISNVSGMRDFRKANVAWAPKANVASGRTVGSLTEVPVVSVAPYGLFRRFGRESDGAVLQDGTVVCRSGARSISVPVQDIEVNIRNFALFANLDITGVGQRLALIGLPARQAFRFLHWVRLRQSADALRDLAFSLDALLQGRCYVSYSQASAWAERARVLLESLRAVPTEGVPDAMASDCLRLADLRMALAQLDARVTERNRAFVHNEATVHRALFETVESYPLSDRQIEAILRDEDHALVVAGAGTGKTSTVIGKVAYLLKGGIVQTHQILALAYNKKAATELQDRISTRLNEKIPVQTFHGLGYRIITAAEKEKPSISDLSTDTIGLNRWVGDQLEQMLRDPASRDLVIAFTLYERENVRPISDFCTAAAYEQYIEEIKPRTITGIRVKSFEERLLGDWLTLNSVRYEYEKPYEYNTATETTRQYRPDFYLPDFGVYIEHFGVDRTGATASFVNRDEYTAGMQWKRELHKEKKTTLVETYSYECQEGNYAVVWADKLRAAKVDLRPISDAALDRLVVKSARSETSVLLSRFLLVARENLQADDDLRLRLAGRPDASRCLAFLDLYEELHRRYVAHLQSRREIDFPDMVARAAALVEAGRYVPPFRRIIVDEFQDISRGRLRLLIALLRAAPETRLMCVGDDWQSIYGFTGSDVGVMVRFAETFGATWRTDLDVTFRFNDRLLAATSTFVQRNPVQLRKTLRARRTRATPAVTVLFADDGLDRALHLIRRDEAFRGAATVLVLGRYNDTISRDIDAIAVRHPMLSISALTVHKSKGLEADYVVVLDVADRTNGFPSRQQSDPVLSLVLTTDGEMAFAEERRLFYVALTRARHRVVVCAPRSAPSAFVEELTTAEYRGLVDVVS